MIRVVIADDHAVVRAGLRAVLSGAPDVSVVAEAANGKTALAAAQTHLPDVLLLDLTMPHLNGLEVIRQVRESAPTVKILVLSMHESPEFVRPAMSAGALGYVVKGTGLDSLMSAVRCVYSGEPYLDPAALAVLDAGTSADAATDPLEQLTSREREVLQFVAEGRTNREVAALLGISAKTVDTHRTSLMRKLDVHSAQALTLLAVRRGLIAG